MSKQNKKESIKENLQQNKTTIDTDIETITKASNSNFQDQQAVQSSLSFAHTIRAVCSAFLLVLWIIVMLPLFYIFKYLFSSKLDSFYSTFHRGCCFLFGMKVTTEGDVSNLKPTLFLSNHISYLDVFALSSKMPGYFIAKSEVASWPVLGALAKLQNTLFFERKGNKIRAQLSIMTNHFNVKKNLILFPEGTSTEGEHVEHFKSSLLQSVEKGLDLVTIQPVTIAYTHYQNKPMNRALRDQYAWYGKMPFGVHFFNALGMKKSSVKIIFHPAVKLTDFNTRKECAFHCWQQVSNGLANANKINN